MRNQHIPIHIILMLLTPVASQFQVWELRLLSEFLFFLYAP
jgi:hypothetical protein